MKATEAKLLEFFKKSPQFEIPIYQRTYSWTSKECQQLWDDIIRAGSNDRISAHFVGSIVYIEKGMYQVSSHKPLLVIDGQQRLTTVTLLIAALANALEQAEEGQREPLDGFSPRKLRNYYLLNPEEDGEKHYKLLLSQTDKTSLIAIVGNREMPKEYSLRITENYTVFQELLAKCKGDYTAICRGLAKLLVVDIALSRDQDNPQLIFESMNSTGRELSQADLIRNYILMGLDTPLQTRLYEDYWRPMEVSFGQEGYALYFDRFMRDYLTIRTGEIPNVRDVYEAFKLHSQSVNGDIELLVKEIREFARYYCAMALDAETEPELRVAFHDLRELKVDVAYPLLLELYQDYDQGLLSQADFSAAVRLIEAYIFRRAICGIPTNSLNKTFANFTKFLDKSQYLASIQAELLELPSYRRFPRDDEFMRELQHRDLYNFRNRSYFLRRLENHQRKERVVVDEYTIEHIMPQNKNLSSAWKDELGADWERVHGTWLHTLGNLTLTAYNSEYSDRPFAQKRDMDGGFKVSPLHLNKGLGEVEQWNEAAMTERAQKLAARASQVWVCPEMPEGLGQAPEPKKSEYSLQDHPPLLGPMREVFEAFRKSVLELDPCVSETFHKLYVAYKAETNFVDAIPQAKRLLLTLNMPYPELYDPKEACKDISNRHHWGNGDVEFSLTNLEDLPYAIGLVRQSFEHQMGNVAE